MTTELKYKEEDVLHYEEMTLRAFDEFIEAYGKWKKEKLYYARLLQEFEKKGERGQSQTLPNEFSR